MLIAIFVSRKIFQSPKPLKWKSEKSRHKGLEMLRKTNMSKASKHIFTFVLIGLVGVALNFSTLGLAFPEQLPQAILLYIFGTTIFITGVVGAVWYIRIRLRIGDSSEADVLAIAEAEASFVKTLPCEYPPSLPQMYQCTPALAQTWVAQSSYVYPIIQKQT